MKCTRSALAISSFLFLAGCANELVKPVESLGGGQDVSRFTISSLKGTRDGERLDVRAVFSDGPRRITVDLRFRVTPPPRMESGTWSGFGSEGTVHERSSTFLGGQSGPPSIGGRFDLIGPDRKPLYRVAIPLQPLNERL